jgi:heparan-alpha-glucosaminide N-acetyltransferase
MTLPPLRVASIDVFRAVTMFLMIFVNDLWTLKDIPLWLEHTAAEADGMGLADTIFPAFLFIVGLSIPFSIAARQSKGFSLQQTELYILSRSFALLIMGFFHVNLENYNESASMLPKAVWQILITIGFFLVWLDYPSKLSKVKKFWMQAAGVLLLIVMAVLYKGTGENGEIWMRPQWWGILGLIGWSYLVCAAAYLYFKNLWVLTGVLLFLLLFNIAAHAGWLEFMRSIQSYFWIVGDASMPALTMAGVVCAVIYRQMIKAGKISRGILILFCIGIVMLAAGFAIRPLAGISKIRATPAWVMICTGISIFFFILFIYLADIKKKQHWFDIIKPAGTSTLTCYLLPYIHYALYTMIGISLPLVLRTGIPGILKSLLYSLVIILIVRVMEKRRVRLKI